MRQVETEVRRIVAGLDEQVRLAYEGTKFAELGFAEIAFGQLRMHVNAGGSLEGTMRRILVDMAGMPVPRDYFEHLLKACAHCASAIFHHYSGNKTEAWMQISDAKAEAGCVLGSVNK